MGGEVVEKLEHLDDGMSGRPRGGAHVTPRDVAQDAPAGGSAHAPGLVAGRLSIDKPLALAPVADRGEPPHPQSPEIAPADPKRGAKRCEAEGELEAKRGFQCPKSKSAKGPFYTPSAYPRWTREFEELVGVQE